MKQINKPAVHQDFEILCYRLWGAIWSIQNNMHLNGKNGQTQNGVDIFCTPKNNNQSYGIQCKNKSGNKKLTQKEIIEEVELAKNFMPPLNTYLIATSADNDAGMQEFVRRLSDKNQSQQLFKIELYCWGDIENLLRQNPDVLDWYLDKTGYMQRNEIEVSFNDEKHSVVVVPTYLRKVKRYVPTEKSLDEIVRDWFNKPPLEIEIPTLVPTSSSKVCKGWFDLELKINNIGSAIVDNWRIVISFSSGAKKIYDGQHMFFYNFDFKPYVDNQNKTLHYSPENNKPLVLKSSDTITISILPKITAPKIAAKWEFYSSSFTRSGHIDIIIEPNYVEEVEYIDQHKDDVYKHDEIQILYYSE